MTGTGNTGVVYSFKQLESICELQRAFQKPRIKKERRDLSRPMSFSQVAALLPSMLSSRSHVCGVLSFIRWPARSLSHAPFIPLRLNVFGSAGYL